MAAYVYKLASYVIRKASHAEAPTQTLHAARGGRPRSGARARRQLAYGGLTTHVCRRRGRYHRPTPAGEDALLPVVAGAPETTALKTS